MKNANLIAKKLVHNAINAEIKKCPRNCIGVIYQPARPMSISTANYEKNT